MSCGGGGGGGGDDDDDDGTMDSGMCNCCDNNAAVADNNMMSSWQITSRTASVFCISIYMTIRCQMHSYPTHSKDLATSKTSMK